MSSITSLISAPSSRMPIISSTRRTSVGVSANASTPVGNVAATALTRKQPDQKVKTALVYRCEICHQELVQAVQVVNSVCKHYFHGYCLKGWMLQDSSCPNNQSPHGNVVIRGCPIRECPELDASHLTKFCVLIEDVERKTQVLGKSYWSIYTPLKILQQNIMLMLNTKGIKKLPKHDIFMTAYQAPSGYLCSFGSRIPLKGDFKTLGQSPADAISEFQQELPRQVVIVVKIRPPLT